MTTVFLHPSSIGTKAYLAPLTAPTPVTTTNPTPVAPNAPTIGAATPGVGNASIAFTPSSSGTAATSYTAVWSHGGSVVGTASPLTMNNLTPGVAGTFHVYATAGGLNSANSAESGSVTPTAATTTPTPSTTVANAVVLVNCRLRRYHPS